MIHFVVESVWHKAVAVAEYTGEENPMTWQVSGRSLDLCSCTMWCPCWLGPEIEPDQGWCAHTFGYEIQQGSSDGVELGGTTVAFTGEWPANFFLGGGRARLYICDTATDEQRRELKAIFSGRKSGHLQGRAPDARRPGAESPGQRRAQKTLLTYKARPRYHICRQTKCRIALTVPVHSNFAE